ncbi:hypothetical protein J6590_033981 [Homalodisca vitripennis]|nr:hypothetical protein J6590_033981 [Homalodisca vitripennis]
MKLNLVYKISWSQGCGYMWVYLNIKSSCNEGLLSFYVNKEQTKVKLKDRLQQTSTKQKNRHDEEQETFLHQAVKTTDCVFSDSLTDCGKDLVNGHSGVVSEIAETAETNHRSFVGQDNLLGHLLRTISGHLQNMQTLWYKSHGFYRSSVALVNIIVKPLRSHQYSIF